MTAIAGLTDHLGFWLRRVSNHVSQSFARKLAAKDVTVAEWVFLRVLQGTGPTAPSRLAAEMGMTRGAISRLADRLLAKALIVRRESGTDGRAQTLGLTAKGARLVPVLAALADSNEAECFAHLSARDRDALRRILEDTTRRLGLDRLPME